MTGDCRPLGISLHVVWPLTEPGMLWLWLWQRGLLLVESTIQAMAGPDPGSMGSDVLPQRQEASSKKDSPVRAARPEGEVASGLEAQVPEYQPRLLAGTVEAPVCMALVKQVPGPYCGNRLWCTVDVGQWC
jgi:hypothetical protein